MDTNRPLTSVDVILFNLQAETEKLKLEIQLKKIAIKSDEYEVAKKTAFRMFFAFLAAFTEGKTAVLYLPAPAEVDQVICRLLIENKISDQISAELQTYIDAISTSDQVNKLRQAMKKNIHAKPNSAPYYNCTSWYLMDEKKTIDCVVVVSSPRRVFLSTGYLVYVNID